MKRRTFFFAMSLITLASPPLRAHKLHLPYSQDCDFLIFRAKELATATFRDLEAARLVGRRYLSDMRGIQREELLEQLGIPTATPAEEYKAAFSDRVKSDFASGNTVSIYGWVLSRSEASLCAICNLKII